MEPLDESVVITFAGELGLNERDEFVDTLPPAGAAVRVVLDLTLVPSVDSTILAALMLYRQRRIIAGGSPFDIVAIVNPRLQRIFDLTGVSRSITVVPSSTTDESIAT